MNREIFAKLLKEREFKAIKSILETINVVDLASLLEELSEQELLMVFRLISKDKAGQTFTYMSTEMQRILIETFTEVELKKVLDDIFIDDTVDIIEEMPVNVIKRILMNIDETKRNQINTLLNYPKDSAGSIMTTEYVSLKQTMTVTEAIRKIKQIGIRKETIYTCYVTEKHKLVGIVTAKDLLTSPDHAIMQDIMETNIISVTTNEDKEVVAKLFHKYDFLALPVLDKEGYIVGIVTVDDAMDVLEEETTEDITKMAAINPSEDSYFDTSIFVHAKNRILWLLVLMLSASITGIIITKYETAFSTIPLLVSFIPMLMDTGGNCGSQSSTLIIRGLALDELGFPDIFKIMWKEFRVATLVSIALSFANGLRIYIMYQDFYLAIVIGISLIATIILAKLVGCTLPLFAKKLKLDPAIMAAPLITTLVDTCSIYIYFSIATQVFAL